MVKGSVMQLQHTHSHESREASRQESRRGGFLVLALFCFVGCLMFVALSIDVGYLSLEKTRMQNAVESAALAAAQEITAAVQNAPVDVEDVTAYALGAARQVAANVAAANWVPSAADVAALDELLAPAHSYTTYAPRPERS